MDVYICEYLDQDILFTLRANREKISKMDSNDDLLVWIVDLLHSKPLSEQTELNKPAVFRV